MVIDRGIMLVTIRKIAEAAAISLILVGLVLPQNTAAAQDAPSPTPLQISLPTSTPQSAESSSGPSLSVSAPTFTPDTATMAILEALDIANVRALPDTNETQLGVIRNGEFYTVTGRYVNWYQLEYRASPTGFGWVYGELVQVTGDTAAIPDVDPYAQPTSAVPGSSDGASGGVIATATSQSPSVLGTDETGIEVFPTFTYPPGLSRPNATDSAGTTADTSPNTASTPQSGDDMPPILPIVILGGLGLFGLAITSLRR
ncbi:MAG: SH3 domain-containing protein [Anaerolineae bacterium]